MKQKARSNNRRWSNIPFDSSFLLMICRNELSNVVQSRFYETILIFVRFISVGGCLGLLTRNSYFRSHTSSDHQVQFLVQDELSAMHGRVSRLADTELMPLIAHFIRPPGSIPGVGWVRRNQSNKQWSNFYCVQAETLLLHPVPIVRKAVIRTILLMSQREDHFSILSKVTITLDIKNYCSVS